ncbi:MAG TPA: MGMT family protein [Jiangellales bacterium]|nr:MGMT family protein [Jiangellales bacterium]
MGSPAFARIRAQVLDVTARVPRGRVTTYAAVGDELEVVPRHVAYLLSMQSDDEVAALPWHRVVSVDGRLARGERGEEQAARLRAEGVPVVGRRVSPLAEYVVRVPLDEQHRAHPSTPLERSEPTTLDPAARTPEPGPAGSRGAEARAARSDSR